MKVSRPAIVIWSILGLAVLALLADEPAKKADPKHPGYEFREKHDPDGIGKFYMGREIAQVMGHQAAEWLERPEREKEEQPTKLIESLKVKPGEVIADIGAGSGYYAFRLSKLVGAKGKILAVDIQPEMLAIIRKKMKEQNVTNIEPIQGTITDPKLPANAVDTILMVDVYHEFDHPFEMTQAMVQALKPGGRMIFVEFRMEDPDVPIKLVHKMTQKQVIKEMEPHPLRWVKTLDVLPWQHIIIFEKKDEDPKKRVKIDTRVLDATENDLQTAQAKISYLGDQTGPVQNVVFTSDASKLSLDLFYDVQREKYNNDGLEERRALLDPKSTDSQARLKSVRHFTVSPREFAAILTAVKPILTKENVAKGPQFLAFVVIYKKGDEFKGQEFRIGMDSAEDFYLKLRGALGRENNTGRKIVTSQFHNALGSLIRSKE